MTQHRPSPLTLDIYFIDPTRRLNRECTFDWSVTSFSLLRLFHVKSISFLGSGTRFGSDELVTQRFKSSCQLVIQFIFYENCINLNKVTSWKISPVAAVPENPGNPEIPGSPGSSVWSTCDPDSSRPGSPELRSWRSAVVPNFLRPGPPAAHRRPSSGRTWTWVPSWWCEAAAAPGVEAHDWRGPCRGVASGGADEKLDSEIGRHDVIRAIWII